MEERFICASDTACKVFADITSAKEYAKQKSENGERVVIYLQYGTFCNAVAFYKDGAEV